MKRYRTIIFDLEHGFYLGEKWLSREQIRGLSSLYRLVVPLFNIQSKAGR